MVRLVLASAVILSACALDADLPLDPPAPVDLAATALSSRSRLGDAVVAALEATAPGERDRTWSVSRGNRLEPGWLVQTPPADAWGKPYAALTLPQPCTSGPGCELDFGLRTCAVNTDCGTTGACVALDATRRTPAEPARRLCAGHSDGYLDGLHALITSAQQSVDVTILSPPDGRFEATLRNAITYLGATGRAVSLRFLFGTFPVGGAVDSKALLTRLTRDLPASAAVTVALGAYRASAAPPSWNHSKIVAVDGQVALVGGHNMWTKHYLDIEPVHDLTVRVAGPAARDAQRFADELWRWTCAHDSWLTRLRRTVTVHRWQRGVVDTACPGDAILPPVPAPVGAVTVIGIGRLGQIDSRANPSDVALVAMIEEARSQIRISQQDIGPLTVPGVGVPLGPWPEPVLEAIGAAIVRGVDVEVVVSGKDASVGGLSPLEAQYANGWSTDDVAREIRKRVAASPGAPTSGALDALLCQRLHVAPLRFSSEDRYPGGGEPGNHAKLVVVDDLAFYVGSQNLYPFDNAEYGYVVDDGAAAATLRTDYWARMWTHSSRLAVSAATCR